MKKLILATAATLMFGGAALAQENPTLGDAPGSTLNDTGSSQDMQSGGLDFGIDMMPTASVDDGRSMNGSGVQIEDVTGPERDDNYSGK